MTGAIYGERFDMKLKKRVNLADTITIWTGRSRSRRPGLEFHVKGWSRYVMVSRLFAIVAIACALSAVPAPAQSQSPEARAASEFLELCRADAGALWGADLCGPLIIANPRTRRAWANEPDRERVLSAGADGWVGTLPQGAPIANSSVEWAGVRWIMVMGPLPEDATERRVLLLHEAWHRAQGQLGLVAAAADCAHLEEARAREWLRLEMRALASALRSAGHAREQAAQEALGFRAARLRDFPSARVQENALDRNEGLAAYTGVRLGAPAPEAYAARVLDRYDTQDSYVRTYPYATGPAYGLLLDQYVRDWRRNVRSGAVPADLLVAQLRVQQPNARDLQRSGDRYGRRTIATEENTRAETLRERLLALRTRFSAGPRLEISLANAQFEFDPHGITAVAGLGNHYGALTLRDSWGELRVTDGAVISSDFTKVILSQPGADGLSGPGWSLALSPEYHVAEPDGSGVRRVEASPVAP
jgi:hypothetical protein